MKLAYNLVLDHRALRRLTDDIDRNLIFIGAPGHRIQIVVFLLLVVVVFVWNGVGRWRCHETCGEGGSLASSQRHTGNFIATLHPESLLFFHFLIPIVN